MDDSRFNGESPTFLVLRHVMAGPESAYQEHLDKVDGVPIVNMPGLIRALLARGLVVEQLEHDWIGEREELRRHLLRAEEKPCTIALEEDSDAG